MGLLAALVQQDEQGRYQAQQPLAARRLVVSLLEPQPQVELAPLQAVLRAPADEWVSAQAERASRRLERLQAPVLAP